MGIREITHQLIPAAHISLMERERGRNKGRGIPSMQHLQKMENERAYEGERRREEERELHSPAPGETSDY